MATTPQHLVLAGFLTVLLACGGDGSDDSGEHEGDDGEHGGHHGDEPHPDCKAISDACHAVDIGEGEISECHGTIAHENDETRCKEEKERCVSLCEAAEADGGPQSGD